MTESSRRDADDLGTFQQELRKKEAALVELRTLREEAAAAAGTWEVNPKP